MRNLGKFETQHLKLNIFEVINDIAMRIEPYIEQSRIENTLFLKISASTGALGLVPLTREQEHHVVLKRDRTRAAQGRRGAWTWR